MTYVISPPTDRGLLHLQGWTAAHICCMWPRCIHPTEFPKERYPEVSTNSMDERLKDMLQIVLQHAPEVRPVPAPSPPQKPPHRSPGQGVAVSCLAFVHDDPLCATSVLNSDYGCRMWIS